MKTEKIEYKWDANQERQIKATKHLQEAFRTKNELKRFFIIQAHENKILLEDYRKEYGNNKNLEKVLKSIINETNKFYNGVQTIQLNTENFVDHPGYKLGFFDVNRFGVELTNIGENLLMNYNKLIKSNELSHKNAIEHIEMSKIFNYK